MNFACKCLNVTIRSRSNKLERVNVDNIPGLMTNEKLDDFFQEAVAKVPELEVIIKEHSALIKYKNVGSWVTHYCCNCSMYTHAVNVEDGNSMILINTKMVMTSEEMEEIKESPDFSPVFRILIDRKNLDDLSSSLSPVTSPEIHNSLQSTLRSLQQRLQEAIDRESKIIDDRINAYTMEQRKILERFQEKAYMDHRLLSRLICKMEEKPKAILKPRRRARGFENNESNSVFNSSTVLSNENQNNSSQFNSIVQSERSINLSVNGHVDKTDSVKTRRRELTSYDAEVFFPLEGMDDNIHSDDYALSSEVESDTDDSVKNEEDFDTRIQKRFHPMLAKSLPVSVPDFQPLRRRILDDTDDEKESVNPIDPHNIRASIKALAKSVHGDTVFGDLPRPRFSTQI